MEVKDIMTYGKFIALHPETEDDIAQLKKHLSARLFWTCIACVVIGICLRQGVLMIWS